MAAADVRSIVLAVSSLIFIGAAIYIVNPALLGIREGFAPAQKGTLSSKSNTMMPKVMDTPGDEQEDDVLGAENAMPKGTPAPVPKAMPKAVPKPAPRKPSPSASVSAEGFADLEDVTGPAAFDNAQGPAGCYPRDQLTPSELLPKDPNSVWAQQNPMGTGSLKGKNFLSAGALIGVNTVGQSLRNANYQLRSEPPNPQVPVSVFYNSTIEPDTNRRDLEIS